jgi:energy-coupling factor transporter ATP-binding protein EcfA2
MNNPKKILEARRVMIDYTRDQAKALIHIESFLESGEHFYLLAGNAGTGKTTIAENIVTYAHAGILAPTNAALKRLRDKFQCNDICEDRFATIHNALYGAPDEDTGEYKAKKGLDRFKVYIVDEASMIDQVLKEDLIKASLSSGCKLVFMGDDFQLEPVGDDPKMFDWEKTEKVLFKKIWRFKINEVRRNDGTILSVATHLRTSESCTILNHKKDDFQIVSRFTNSLPKDIASKTSDFVVLVSTNKRRMQYNKQIRIAKFGNKALESVVIDGERLISVSNQQYLNGEMYTVKNPEITNAFVGDVNIGSRSYPDWQQYRFYLVKHFVPETDQKVITLLVPALDKPSLHPQQLDHIEEIYKSYTIMPFDKRAGKKIWNRRVNIATYGYATSVHKSQGNEWDTVYIDCDWLSEKWGGYTQL